MTSCPPPTACWKKTNASLPLPPVMVVEPNAEPAISVSLPEPAISNADEEGTVVLTDSQTDEEEPDAFIVSLPEPATRKFLPLAPVRSTIAPGAPKTVTAPVPLFALAVTDAPRVNTTPPEPAITEAPPVPPNTDETPVPPMNAMPPDPPMTSVAPVAVTEVGLAPPETVSPLPVTSTSSGPAPPTEEPTI